MKTNGKVSARGLLLGAALTFAALLLAPSLGEAQVWTAEGESVEDRTPQLLESGETTFGRVGGQSIYLQKLGSTTFGRVGRETVFLQQIGSTTFGRVGEETVYLNRIGSMTVGRIGNRQVGLDRIEVPAWNSDPDAWRP